MKKIIYLIGFMGCGKTTIGKMLSEKLGYSFIDTDKYILKKQDKDIDTLYKEIGEEGFRQLEKNCLSDIAENARKKQVVSTGGGILLEEENIKLMRENGYIIFIDSNIDDIKERLKNSKTIRPVLQDIKDDNGLEAEFMKRHSLYEEVCNFKISGENMSPFNLCQNIYNHLKQIGL
ncbi:MAG: shikimate kinase [Clostridia bacterium]|nr:shikimate kinase [Clostridia bacterium]